MILSNWWENKSSWGTWFPIPLRAEALPGMDDGPGTATFPCRQTHGPVGITSTPVIDPDTSTMYLVFRTGIPLDIESDHHDGEPNRQGKQYRVDAHHWLAAIDIATGRDRHAPVDITADEFNPTMQLNRPGLLLVNHPGRGPVIYVGFGAAVCDFGGNPYTYGEPQKAHGWVFAYRSQDLKLLDVFNTTPPGKGTLAGIWQSGNGLAADRNGSVYAITGNSYPPPHEAADLAESFLKLRLGPNDKFMPVEHFKVKNWKILDGGDTDLGSGGPIVLPSGHIMGGGKQGRLYVIDPAHMATARQAFQGFFNTWHREVSVCNYARHQECGPNIHGSPIVWSPEGVDRFSIRHALVYGMPEKDFLRAFKAYPNGNVEPAVTTERSGIRSPDGMPGAFLSLSANGGRNGIVWASFARSDEVHADTTHGQVHGRLFAFDALTLEDLWCDPSQNVAFAKFVPPTVAGGKVFRAAYQDEVIVYGQLPHRRPWELIQQMCRRVIDPPPVRFTGKDNPCLQPLCPVP